MQTNNTWHELFFGVLGNAIWTGITASLAALYLSTKDRSKFNGRWSALIRWTPEWAESHLTGSKCPDPNSKGKIALSYGSGLKRNQYWGLGVWRLRDGSDDLAELCVEFHAFEVSREWSLRPPFLLHTLKSCQLTSRIRHEIGAFRYAKRFANYEVIFSKASGELLLGTIQARADASKSPSMVGEMRADRIS